MFERLDAPLLMKLDGVHFPVFADGDVATDTLELPETLLAETTIESPPTCREVLVATAEFAGHLLRWVTPYELAPAEPVPG
jgi:hypothetical protein